MDWNDLRMVTERDVRMVMMVDRDMSSMTHKISTVE
jgi:hypothetical protein